MYLQFETNNVIQAPGFEVEVRVLYDGRYFRAPVYKTVMTYISSIITYLLSQNTYNIAVIIPVNTTGLVRHEKHTFIHVQ